MQLSKNFWLSEFIKSQTALRNGIDNSPSRKEIENLENLAKDVLQPIRDYFGTVMINSGFRCLELNRAIGSSDSSQHVLGQAADIEVSGISNYKLAKWIEANCTFDQLILEMYDPRSGPNSGWVHVSYVKNRNQPLTYYRNGKFVPGLKKS